MKFDDFSRLSPMERREFLKFVSGFIALPFFGERISDSTRHAIMETLLGKAHAQNANKPINFIEINFRDQWDFGHVFVPPGIAKSYQNIKNQIALFDNPIQERNGFYVTPQAGELRPHLDSIAVMELGENTLDGTKSIHGHEAGNPLRSPGRVKGSAAGKKDMASVDKRPGEGGNEILYSATPTPLILHNHYQKSVSPNLRNGVLMRSSVRPNTHTFYHFEGFLQNAQVDRFFDRGTLLQAFKNITPPVNPTTLQKHGPLVARLLKIVDPGYLQRIRNADLQNQHNTKLNALEAKLGMTTPLPPTNLNLTTQEMTYWTKDIPALLNCPGDVATACSNFGGLWNIGEMYAYAVKLLQSGQVRSIGIDINMSDVHTNRTPSLMTTMAYQTSHGLGRLIENLKSAGLYENTLIAMYTTDGSRSPLLSSTGDGTKNAVVLAGGMVKGGYYGDLRMENGRVSYHRPDDNGNPVANGTTGGQMRVPAADVYKTVATAMGIPNSVLDTLADVRNGKVMRYMLKA